MPVTASLSAVFRRFLFVREVGGANTGAWVSFFQRFAGGQDGDSWCADVLCVVEDIAYHGHSPSRKTGSTHEKMEHARLHGWLITSPKVDDLYFYITDAGHAHHVGVVTNVTPLVGIAGNTSVDGNSSNGTGVFEHALVVQPQHIVFARLPPSP